MNSYRNNPDGPENQQATRDNESYVGGLKLQHATYPRTNYEMTPADLEKILDACKPVPLIMLQFGMPPSQQERANDAWAELGKRMGFDHMTVQPTGQGDRFFTAIPSETEQHRSERLQHEKEEARRAEVKRIEAEIKTLQDRLSSSLTHE